MTTREEHYQWLPSLTPYYIVVTVESPLTGFDSGGESGGVRIHNASHMSDGPLKDPGRGTGVVS